MKKTIIIVVLFLICSCAPKKQIAVEENTTLLPPKIIFLNYSIKKNNHIKKMVSLINKIVVDGKLKGNDFSKNKKAIGDLECVLLDKDLNEIEQIIVKNPLRKDFEYLNTNKEYEKKIILLDSAEFSIRLQLPPKCKHIRISELTKVQAIELITTQIN
ncbi:hypothetical protein [Psychroserpens sp. MEBiC05023]